MHKKLMLLAFALFSFFHQSNAQVTAAGDLDDLIENLDSTQVDLFDSLLDSLNGDLLNDTLNNSGVMDSLNNVLDGDNPIADLDSLFNDWHFAGDSLLGGFNVANLDSMEIPLDSFDVDTILGEFANVNDIWNLNLDSLGNIFDGYQDSLDDNNISVILPPGNSLDIVEDDILGALDSIELGNGTGVANIFDQIFNQDLFSMVELAYGQKEAAIKYYNKGYHLGLDEVQVIRLGTVPRLETDWEANWSVTATWSDTTFWRADNTELAANIDPDKTLSPLTIDCNFGMTYQPKIVWLPTTPMTVIRMINTIGIDVNTYVPDHIYADIPATANNVGYTTSCGPQISTGFSITRGPLATYTMATMTYGVVGNSPYNYTGLVFEAGVRYGNVVNVRYSRGSQDWAEGNKQVNTINQITVGLIIDSLFR